MTATTGITVTGRGSVTGAPDTAQLRFAAEAGAANVELAVERASTAIAAMRAVLLERGIEPKDLRSSQVSVNVDHGRGQGPRGYIGRFGLTATLSEVAAAGRIAQAVLSAGGDAARLDGLSFAHSDPASLQSAARAAAFADAQAKGEQLAELAGQALGVIEEITDVAGGGGGGPIVPVRMMAAEAGDMAFDAGEQEVTSSLTVRWAWA